MSRKIWTVNKCKTFAAKCKTRSEMLKRFPQAYDAAVAHNWLNIIFSDHPNTGYSPDKKQSGYWTNERLSAAAARCDDRKSFMERYPSAYGIASKKGMMDELFAEYPNQGFELGRKRPGYWQTKENCAQAAKQCKTRSEFFKRFKAGYWSAIQHGWLEEICDHMEIQGNKTKRFIYEFIDLENKEVYVGLTYSIRQRLANHKSQGRPEIREMLKRNCIVKVSPEPIPAAKARLEEDRLIKKWRSQGFIVWNQVKAGALGAGNRHWTFERCQAVANKCKNREEMRRKFNGAAQTAVKNGWMDKIFKRHANQGFTHKPHGYWTLNRIKKLAKKYNSRGDFQKAERSAYGIAHQKKWLDQIFDNHANNGHLTKKKNYWTYEKCQAAASQAKTRGVFYRDYPGAVGAAIENDWMEEIFKDIPNRGYTATPRNYWTFEKLSKEVHRYLTRSEFKKANPLAFLRAQREKQLNTLFANHPNQGYTRPPVGNWTISKSKVEAKKFKSKMELKKNAWGAYNCLRKNGLLEDFFPKRKLPSKK